MIDAVLGPFVVLLSALLLAVWGTALATAYVRGNRATEAIPGTTRRVLGALAGLFGAPLPLLAALASDVQSRLVLAAAAVCVQQLAGGLTFLGTLAAWRRVDRQADAAADAADAAAAAGPAEAPPAGGTR